MLVEVCIFIPLCRRRANYYAHFLVYQIIDKIISFQLAPIHGISLFFCIFILMIA